MTREQKYPETETFHYYNANPHNRKSCDCAVRAICTALEQTWEQTLKELTEIGLKYGYVPTDGACYEKYFEEKGWTKCNQPKHLSLNTKYTGDEWCRSLQNKYGVRIPNIVARIGGHHVVAIIDGKVNDIWDSTGGCIGNYWVEIG